jgi:hypothetical protein
LLQTKRSILETPTYINSKSRVLKGLIFENQHLVGRHYKYKVLLTILCFLLAF